MGEYDNNVNETQNYAYAQQENPSKAFGIVSLVCGILAIPLICCAQYGIIVPIASIVFGILSINKEDARGVSMAGIICSAIAIIAVVAIMIYVGTHMEDIMNMLQGFQQRIEY